MGIVALKTIKPTVTVTATAIAMTTAQATDFPPNSTTMHHRLVRQDKNVGFGETAYLLKKNSFLVLKFQKYSLQPEVSSSHGFWS